MLKSLLLVVALGFATRTSAQENIDLAMRAQCVELLKEEGFTPELLESGEIFCKVYGDAYVISPRIGNPGYFYLNWYIVNVNDNDLLKTHVIMNRLNETSAMTKFYLTEDNMLVVESFMLVPRVSDTKMLFTKVFNQTIRKVEAFKDAWRNVKN